MRAVASSSPSVRPLRSDLTVTIDSIRPHARVAAGVSVFVRYDGPEEGRPSVRARTPAWIRFDLDREIARSARLSQDREIPLGDLRELRHRSETTFVVADAVALLVRRDHSATEIRRKLARRGYGDLAIEYALETLRDREVQDDRRFVRSFIEQRMRRRPISRHALQAALLRRGVAYELVEEEIRRYHETDPDCFHRAVEAAVDSMHDREAVDDQTLLRRLMQRGFSVEDAKKFFA